MTSYGFGGFLSQILTAPFGMYVFFFYETEIGLDSALCALGFVLYSIWNAINDPLIGYITERIALPFETKWGKRFPWIIMGALPWGFTYLLIFLPPYTDPVKEQWLIFLWLLITSCLFDTLFTIWDVNYQSIYPDKFQDFDERRTTSGIVAVVGIIGIVTASVLPPLFVKYGDMSSYVRKAWILIGASYIILALLIPSVREDRDMMARHLKRIREQKNEESFFEMFIIALKQRNFLGFIILYCLYQSSGVIIAASANFIVKFVLRLPPINVTYLMAAMLGGSLIAIPFWVKLSHRLNDNRKMLLIVSTVLTVTFAPMIFTETLLGGIWFMVYPVFGDVIDHIVVQRKKRQDGVFMGFRAFAARLSLAVQAITFAVVHKLCGFVEGATDQSPEAVWGIHIQSAVVPIGLMIVGIFFFWKLYKLTPEKMKIVKEQLMQLGI
jgi:GPH family glycoside/pentoside/hexuronide:cation symporter